ncbi:hypothetical protein AJ78_01597 [Emergomyces pasteurianus Ep9510]|uniref:holo-[acyl-carrier-protein] synthase n=1 Tax=Emergomyces pasteurianus Ep9510 TaxID=1447872 RepID=A0A1J9PPJ4_9EURO|nr:hypothetical protein AJ78_01597 [Emergomyces pasteurianus Ep9510]
MNMPSLPSPSPSSPILTRWYIDTRPLTATTQSLPFLSTLQESDQTTIKAFYHLSDRHMSLASYLLKYLFIHRSCRVPWNQIVISRTPAPHKRPCYIPQQHQPETQLHLPGNESQNPNPLTSIPTANIEFNVSHQASLIALAGCVFPAPARSEEMPPTQPRVTLGTNSGHSSLAQIGIDITCTDDPARRNRGPPKTEAELHAFIDIFSEVFSQNELDAMKADPRNVSGSGGSMTVAMSLQDSITHRIRLFYTYWALKEAYIKMTGEALLAPWLRDLEFRYVTAPVPPTISPPCPDASLSSLWGVPETGVRATLYGREVPEVRLEVVAFGDDYIFATAARGGGFGNSMVDEGAKESKGWARWDEFRLVDIERDIGSCAKGECECLG